MNYTNNTLNDAISEAFANPFHSPMMPEDELMKMLVRIYERFQLILFCFGLKAKRSMRSHANYILHGESGIGTIEMVLILVVLIALVLVFKGRINDLLTNIFDQIDSSAQSVY